MAAAEDAGEDGAAGKGAGGESAECLLVDGEGEDPSLGELGDAVDEQVLAVAQLDAERLLIAGRVPLADDVRKLCTAQLCSGSGSGGVIVPWSASMRKRRSMTKATSDTWSSEARSSRAGRAL